MPRDAQIVVTGSEPDYIQLRTGDRVVPAATKVQITNNKAFPYFVRLIPTLQLRANTHYTVVQHSQTLGSFLTGPTFGPTHTVAPVIDTMEAHRAPIPTTLDASCWWGQEHEQVSAWFDSTQRVGYYEFAFLANGVQHSLVTVEPQIVASNDCLGSLAPDTVIPGSTICGRVRAVSISGVISEGSATHCATIDVCELDENDIYSCQPTGCASARPELSLLIIGALLLLRVIGRRDDTNTNVPTHNRDPR